jgi:hypothetical protein
MHSDEYNWRVQAYDCAQQCSCHEECHLVCMWACMQTSSPPWAWELLRASGQALHSDSTLVVGSAACLRDLRGPEFGGGVHSRQGLRSLWHSSQFACM